MLTRELTGTQEGYFSSFLIIYKCDELRSEIVEESGYMHADLVVSSLWIRIGSVGMADSEDQLRT